MSGHGEKQSRQTEAALSALLACPTIEEAAKQAGVSSATLRRWLAEEDFQRRYRDARRQVVEQAVTGLQQATSDAVKALTRNLTCGVPSAEIAAAKAIIDQSFQGMEVLDLVARVEQLEDGQTGDSE